jgi:hypothetical protein
MWRVVVCDLETLKTRTLKPATGLWKIKPQWVVTPGKQTNNSLYMNMQEMHYPTNKYTKYKLYSPKRPSSFQLITLQNLLLLQHMPEYTAVHNVKCSICK